MSGNINLAFQWAVKTCNAPSVGYSQAHRQGETINGITYYDCSSFISASLTIGGFFSVNPWFTTATMRPYLLQAGFVKLPGNTEMLPGDILWRSGHTEMCYDTTHSMGAHTANTALQNQVSIITNSPGRFTEIYRCGSGATGEIIDVYDWYIGTETEYLSQEHRDNNAICVWQFFGQRGWSINAVSAMCGNMDRESTMNPALIEVGGTGHGLVQWTPPRNLYDVLDVLYGSHDDWKSGEKQCNAIYAEFEQSAGINDRGIEPQWYPTTDYNISWEEWSTSTESVEYLTMAFLRNYERAGVEAADQRIQSANYFYELLSGINPFNNIVKKSMPLYMMVKKKRW